MKVVHRFVQMSYSKVEGEPIAWQEVKTVPAGLEASGSLGRCETYDQRDLERVTGLSVRGKNVTVRARMDWSHTWSDQIAAIRGGRELTFTSALLTSHVPNARNGIAVLALTQSGATTAVVEVDQGINALVVTTNQAGNRASGETFRTRGNVPRAVLAFFSGKAFVFLGFIIVVTGRLSGFTGGSGRVGWIGVGWGRVAAERAVGPFPVVTALRGRGVIGWLVRSTTSQSIVPRPTVGAVFAGRWTGIIVWSSGGKTGVFTVPSKSQVSTHLLLQHGKRT